MNERMKIIRCQIFPAVTQSPNPNPNPNPDPDLRVADDERGVASHEEVAPGGRDERRHEADKVVVHVAGIPQCGGGCGHHRAHDGVELPYRRVGDAQAIDLGTADETQSTAEHGREANKLLSRVLPPSTQRSTKCTIALTSAFSLEK